MKVSLIQLNASKNKEVNIKNAVAMVTQAAESGSEFVLLPEVFNYRGPFSGKILYNDIAEKIPGKSLEALRQIAKKYKIYILAGSIYERSKQKYKVYNTSVFIDEKGLILDKYRKINLFRAFVEGKNIDESKTFDKGKKTVLCNVLNRNIGLSICFDLRFPELYRKYFQQKVDIIVIPSSFTKKTGKKHWEPLLRARAIENHCFVLAPNQFGIDGNGVETYGHSMIVDPQGEILGELDSNSKGILTKELLFNNNSYLTNYK